MKLSLRFALAALILPLFTGSMRAIDLATDLKRVPVVFSGGHETDPRDGGRPVILVASALGVPADVFREAFSHVHPAPAGTAPEQGQVRANKAALMSALGKYGVTNERLDQVSNYYRYVRSRGDLWTNKPAVANALVKDGLVVGYEVLNGGAGYTSAPTVAVEGAKVTAPPEVKLNFGKDLVTNGSITAMNVPATSAK